MADGYSENPKMEQILNELHNSNKEILSRTEVLVENKDQKIEDNIVNVPTVNSSLSGDEKARYANIGKEMFAPILSALEKMLKNEKKKNDMTIAGGDEEQMKEDIKIQYQPPAEKEKENDSWFDKLMEVIGWLGVGALLFGPKIEEFFKAAWEWVTELFGSIASFFSTADGPIAWILDLCTNALTGLWKLVTNVFKGLANVGTWIWNGIKSIFTTFISGPNGILNFGIKIVNGIINFAKNAVNWLGNLITSAILDPIKAIFGGAKETAEDAGQEAAKDTVAQANKAVHQQEVAAKAVSDRAIMSQQGAEAEWSKCVASSRAAVKKQAEEAKLAVNKDGTISDDAIKARVAEDMLKNFEAENGQLDDEERKEMIEAMKKEIQVKDGQFKIEGEKMREAMIKAADDISSSQAWDSGALDSLQDLNGKQFNNIIAGQAENAQKYLEIQARANVQNEFDKKTEDEKFLWRMQQAKESGQLAEFRIAEAREMILNAIKVIKESFATYDKMLTDNFISAIKIFSEEIGKNIKVFLVPFELNDDSTNNVDISPVTNNNTEYNIMPLSKEDFRVTSSELINITREGTQNVIKQTAVLNQIKEILAASPEVANINIEMIKKVNREKYGFDEEAEANIYNSVKEGVDNFVDKAGNAIGDMANEIKGGLWKAASSFFD